MTFVVNEKTRTLFPPSVRKRAGIKVGSKFDVRVSSGIVSFIPQLPSAKDEYTAEQRRRIDAELAQSLDDVKHGRVYTFDSHEEMMQFLDAGPAPTKSSRKSTKTKAG